MTTMRGEGSWLWMCSSMAGKGGKHRDQPGVIHGVHRRRGPVAS